MFKTGGHKSNSCGREEGEVEEVGGGVVLNKEGSRESKIKFTRSSRADNLSDENRLNSLIKQPESYKYIGTWGNFHVALPPDSSLRQYPLILAISTLTTPTLQHLSLRLIPNGDGSDFRMPGD